MFDGVLVLVNGAAVVSLAQVVEQEMLLFCVVFVVPFSAEP